MAKPVLQARYVGQAPDLRHPLAPPEHVFICEEPARPGFLERFWNLSAQKKITLFSMGFLVFVFARAAIYLATGDDIIR